MQNAFLLAAAADFALALNSSNMMTCPPTANTVAAAAAAHLSVLQKRISFALCFFIWLDLILERTAAAAATAANAKHYF